MKKSLKLLLFGFAVFFSAPSLFAQLDTKHYIPPMFGREDEGTHYIVLSTPSTTPFDVTITDGSGTIITTQNISNVSSSSYLLGAGVATQFLVQESELNTVMANEGLILTGNFPFYVNMRVLAGAQAGSLTSKGAKAALGTDFRTGHLFNNDGDDYRKSNVFGIMATEDNTTINITDISAGVIFKNTPQTAGTSDDITVVLNEGESYVVAAYLDEPGSTNNINGVNGTHITSDKNIVVNSGSWLGGNAIVGGTPNVGRDLGIDQIVPIDLIGNEYVVIKGEGIDNEKVIVIATVDGTDIFLNGSAVPTTTLNAGDFYTYVVTDFTANENMFIESTEDVYVYQTENSGDGTTDDNERQCGLNFLPPIGCSGSKSVQLPDVDFIGTAQINIIANTGSAVIVDGTPLGAGDAVTGTGSYVTYKLANAYTGDILITSDDLTRVSLINLSGNVGAAGYFSGFTKDITVQTNTVNADNIALEGCIPASFTFGIDAPSTDDTEITYQVLGSATNGVDYEFIDTVLTIPAGQTEGTIFINTFADALPEGQETVYIIYQPDLCSPVDTAILFIDDAQPIEFTLDGVDLTCFENSTGEINVNASGGFPPYTFHVTDNSGNGTTIQYLTNPITGLDADTYSVQVYDIYGCKAEALLIGGIFDADTTFLPDGTGVSYDAILNIQGFQPGQTLDNISQLQQVCATMEHSYLGDLQIKIISPSGEEVILKEFNGGGSCDLGEPFASGPVDGANSNLTDPGIGFEYCWNATPNYGTMVAESNNYTHTIPASVGGTYTDNYLPAGAYTSFEILDGLVGADLNGDWTMEVSDQFNLDNGYIFNWNISLQSELPDTLVTINEPEEIEVAGFVTQAQCGGADGAIDVSVTGDFPPYTFNWSSGQTTEDISGIVAGTYTVYATDGNGCMDSMTFNLNNISSMNTTIAITPVTCSGGVGGAIDVLTSGGTAPYTWSWSNGPTTEDISGLSAGTYTITITDDNGCIYTEDIVVTTLPAIDIALDLLTNDECSQNTGAIDLTVSGGTGSFGFSWDNGATTEDISSLGVGTYYLTVVDGNGCTALDNFSVINNVSNCSGYCYTNIITEALTDENCGDGTGAIDITVMDATMPYVISWDNGPTTDDQTGLAAGTYTATIVDANQCELIQEFIVGNDVGTIQIDAVSVSNENCGNGDGSIDITVSGGSLPYTFAWSNAATTEDVTGLAAGSYDVTITDNVGCELTVNYVVGNNTGTLAESASVSPEICGNGGGSINLTVSGGVAPYTYLWSNASTNQDLSALAAGTYSVTITDNVGCTLASQDYTVVNTAGDLEILTTTINNENCTDGAGSIDINVINGTTPYTYLWTPGLETTEDLTSLSAGTYNCTVTDDNGCSVATGDLILFNQGGNLAVSTNSTTDEVCTDGGGQIDIDVTGGLIPYTFLWSNAATTEDITGLSAGSYTVTVTDNNGCSIDYVESIQNSSPGFSVSISGTTDEVCGDGSGSINTSIIGGAAPISYLWSDGQTTANATGLSAGTYSVVITDNNGCVLNTSASIAGGGIDIISSLISDEICGDLSGSIDITFSGGVSPYNFAWSNGGTTEDLSGLAAGTYNLTITGTGGCTAIASYNVGNNTNGLTVVSAVVTDENCGDAAGAISVTISGGALPISYDWSNGATTEDLTNLIAGAYSVVIEDVNGCTVSTNGTVINNSAGFTASINTITDENCGDGTGAIDVDVAGGSLPYTFSWDNAAITEDILGLNAGDYELTVTDNNGCSIVISATVNNNTGGFALSNEVVGDASCSSLNGFIDIGFTGGSVPYTYLWSPGGETTEDLAGLAPGNYTCVITDNVGCVINYTGEVLNTGGAVTANETIQNESCGNGEGSITVDVTGGIAPYVFSWTGATPTTCCEYTLDMTDQGNSWNGASVTVQINGTSIGDFTVPGGGANTETFTACTGDLIELIWNAGGFDNEIAFDLLDPDLNVLFAQGGGPTPGPLFSTTASCPTGPGNQTEITGLSAGTYTLTITDNVGCEIIEVYNVIDQVSDVSIDLTSTTDETCGNNNGEIVYSISGGTAPFVTTANGFTDGPPVGVLSNLFADDWEIITIDDNGCTDTLVIIIANTATFTTAGAVTDEACADGLGAIDITITGGSLDMDYDWDNGETTQDLSNLSEGTYEVTITDNTNGCEDVQSFTVVNVVDLTLSASITDENCSDGTGAIDITVTGSTDLAIAWSNGESTEDISGLNGGDYMVTIINNTSGCVVEETYTVNNTTTGMLVDITSIDEDCGNADGSINLTVSSGVGPFSYLWSPGGETTEDLSGLTPGDYTVTVTDDNDGCQYIETVTILSDGDFNLDLLSVTNETCLGNDGAIDIDVSGPGTFNTTIIWTPNGETTEDITGLTAGAYNILVTNNFGCTMSLDVDVDLDADITVLSAFGDETCGDGAGFIDLTVSGSTDLSYAWLPNGETTEDLTGLSAGTYDVTVTNNTSGCVQNVSITIANINVIDLTLAAVVTDENCSDGTGSIDLTVTGSTDLSYSWTPNGETTEDLSGLSGGDYTVTVINNTSGCFAEDTYTVTNVSTGMLVDIVSTDEDCGNADGAIDVTVTLGVGPFTYLWSPGGETTEDLSGLTPGDYTVTVTDDNDGCQYVEMVTILSDGEFNLDLLSLTNETCAGDDGAIDMDISGPGTFNTTIIWTPNGETTEDLTGLAAGTYGIEVTNDNGCTMSLDVDVAIDADFSVVSFAADEACGDGTGAIDLTVTGSTDLSYAWMPNGETTEDLTGLSAGTYDVTVTNNTSGCQQMLSITIDNPTTGVAIPGIALTNEFCSDGTGTIDITVVGGVGPYSYLWTPGGETTEDLTGLSEGAYSVTVTDDNDGCAVSMDFDITNTTNFTVSGVVTNSSCATCTTGEIDASVNEIVADGPYTFLWSPGGETTEDITGLTPGSYTVTVTGASGCAVDTTFIVGDNDDVGLVDSPVWNLQVYPNPTRIDVNIAYDFFTEDKVEMTITNLLGQDVYTKVIKDKNGLLTINIEEFRAGIYFIQFNSEDQNRTVKLTITE